MKVCFKVALKTRQKHVVNSKPGRTMTAIYWCIVIVCRHNNATVTDHILKFK